MEEHKTCLKKKCDKVNTLIYERYHKKKVEKNYVRNITMYTVCSFIVSMGTADLSHRILASTVIFSDICTQTQDKRHALYNHTVRVW